MGTVSRYWRLVRIDATGHRKEEDLKAAKAFFQGRFPDVDPTKVPDTFIQADLMGLIRKSQSPALVGDAALAYQCLCCFISHQAERVCIDLELRFGDRHSFTRYDLFPFVLDYDGRPRRATDAAYRLLADDILESFEPKRASLSTWSSRIARHHPDLNQFLREHGVSLVSDWAILSDTSPDQLQRVLSEFHTLTPSEVSQALVLLNGYHLIYRQDRRQQRLLGLVRGKERCLPPTSDQLTRIAQYVYTQTASSPPISPLSAETIMRKLQTLATQLRDYRIYSRGGTLPTQSLDDPDTHTVATAVPAPNATDEHDEQREFLRHYQQQFLHCLDGSLRQVLCDRLHYLERKNKKTAHDFRTALHLFHCQGKSMADIAKQLQMQAQYQVTRLIKLKELRAQVRHQLLLCLSSAIAESAQKYVDPKQLQQRDRLIETVLNEHIDTLMQQAETEALMARSGPLSSVFSRQLCHHLDRGLDCQEVAL